MNDVLWNALIVAGATLVLSLMTYLTARLTAATTAVNAEATDRKLAEIAETGEKVHVLVNSSMSAQLKISMVALKRIAELTEHPDDMAAAELATKLYNEHQKKQEVVDSEEDSRTA